MEETDSSIYNAVENLDGAANAINSPATESEVYNSIDNV